MLKRSEIIHGAAAFLFLVSFAADAHRSGCHRWHSCPSDHGTYVCGDAGHCSQCPDNQFCQKGQPRRQQETSPKQKIETPTKPERRQ